MVKIDAEQPVEWSGGRQTGIKAHSNRDGKEGSQEGAMKAPSSQQDIERPVVSRGRLGEVRTERCSSVFSWLQPAMRVCRVVVRMPVSRESGWLAVGLASVWRSFHRGTETAP